MANIHGLNHNAARQDQPQGPGGNRAADAIAAQQNFWKFMPGQHPEQIKDPRRENLFDLYKYTFCPNFKLCSTRC